MKILIIKTSSLGDIIHAFPVLEFLRKRFPEAKIDWVVENQFAELVEAHPDVNDVFRFHSKTWRKKLFNRTHIREIIDFNRQVRREEYDVTFDLQGNVKSSLVTMQVKSKWKVGFSLKNVPEWPNILVTNQRYRVPAGRNIREDYMHLAKSFLKDTGHYPTEGVLLQVKEEHVSDLSQTLNVAGDKRKVMVCPGSAWLNKQMTVEGLSNFLKRVQDHLDCYFFFIWGNQEELTFVKQLEKALPNSTILERQPLSILQNMMSHMDLVIAMDSLPLHLAGTTKTPTFSVFGPSLADKYKPLGDKHHAFQGKCPYKQSFEKRCSILRTCPTGACIRGLDGEEVFQDFLRRMPFGARS